MDTDWMIVTDDSTKKVVHEEPLKGRTPGEVRKLLEAKYPFSKYTVQYHTGTTPTSSPSKDGWNKGWETDALREPAHSLTH